MKTSTLGLGLVGLLGMSQANAQQAVYEGNGYEVRGYFRLLDAEKNEVRHVTPSSTNLLQLRTQILKKLAKPVKGYNFDIEYPKGVLPLEAVPLNEQGFYTGDDIFCQYGTTNCYVMGRLNEVFVSGGVRETKPAENGKERLGPLEGDGNLAQMLIKGYGTNYATGFIRLSNFVAGESGGIRKPARIRSLRVAFIPEGYKGRHLYADMNDGEEPANDWLLPWMARRLDEFKPISDGRVFAPEPFMVGQGILYRSTEGAAGPWTAVYTNSAPAASFSDSAMKGVKNVFYKFEPRDIAPASASPATKPSTQSLSPSPSLENTVK